MRKILLSFTIILMQLGCSQEKVSNMPITNFKQEFLKNAILVDVRTPEEFEAGHIKNAQNINWLAPNFAETFKKINKDKVIYVYCKLGGRSAKAQEKLKSLGYTHVVNLEGGYDAFKGDR